MKYLPRFVFLLLLTALTALGSVSSQATRIAYTISALPQACPTAFQFNSTATVPDLLVLDGGAGNSATSPPVTLVLNSDYTVTGGGYNSQNQLQTGTVTIISGGTNNVQVGDVITILRKVPFTQTTAFSAAGFISPLMIEAGLDKLTTEVQQVNDLVGLSLSFQKNEVLSPQLVLSARENFGLGFTNTGAIMYFVPGSGGGGGGGPPTGPAAGVLSGTYPNPGFASIAAYSFLSNNTGSSAAPASNVKLVLPANTNSVLVGDNVLFPTWQGPSSVAGRSAFYLQREGGTAGYFAFGAGQNTGMFGYASGGTFASPAATSLARNLNQFTGNSYGGATWALTGSIVIATTQDHTESARGTEVYFTTTPNNSTTTSVVGRWSNGGNLLVGTNSETGLTGAGGIHVASTTDATSSTAGAVLVDGGLAVAKKIISGSEAKAPYGVFTGAINAYDSAGGGLYTAYAAGAGILRSVADNSGSYAPLSIQAGNGTQVGIFTNLGLQGDIGQATPGLGTFTVVNWLNNAGLRTTKTNAHLLINVKDYGAIGDGGTNDTTAINAAIAAMTNWSTLYFPAGSYLVTPGSLSAIASLSHITIMGDGRSSQLSSTATGSPGNFLVINSSSDHVTIRDLAIIGSATARGSGIGIRMYASYSIVSNVYISGTSDFGFLFTNDAGGYTVGLTVVNCTSDHTLGDGFHFGAVTDSTFANCLAYYTGDDGVGIGDDGAVGFPCTRLEVANFQSIQAGNHAGGGTHGSGIRLFDGAVDIHIVGGSIYQSCEAGIQTTRATSTTAYCTRIKLDGVKVYQCLQTAGMYANISIAFANQVSIANCWSEAPVSQGCYAFLDCNNLTVTGNTAKDAVVRSFLTDDGTTTNVAATWSNWTIMGNVCLGTPSGESYYFVPATGKAIANLIVTGNTETGQSTTNYIFTNRLATAAKINNNTSLGGKSVANGGSGISPTTANNN